jgi:uncharacterized protein (TIGR02391 family)
MPTLRIIADVRAKIRELVEVMAPFLPLSTRSGNAITFTSLFRESGIHAYLSGPESKKQALQKAWELVFRRHVRLPHVLVRKIVPAAVDYRRFKRDPLKQVELDRLIACLTGLGVDMQQELGRIKLDETVPEIQVPPAELVRRLENHPLAEEVRGGPRQLFRNGHFNESIRKAAERFEVAVQKLSRRPETGKDLMGKVFKLDPPILQLNALSTDNERGVQEGYMLMTMGMMRAIRNIFSHGDEAQRSPEECFEMLLFLNWLFRQLPK